MNAGSASKPGLLRLLLAAIVVAGAMTAILGLQIEKRAAILRDGTEVLLKTAPVDPRDLFRGDYVVLSYDIGRVAPEIIVGDKPGPEGSAPLWVRLKPQPDGYWTVAEASFSRLEPLPDSAVLRSLPVELGDLEGRTFPVFVEYGIERYYVPEGEGLVIEEARNQSLVSIAARIGNAGDAQIRALMIDGKPVYNEPLY